MRVPQTIRAFILLLCVWFVYPGVVYADLEPEDVGLLFSSQILFGPAGIPLVTIGIMDDQKEVRLSSEHGLDLFFQSQENGVLVKKSLQIPARQSVTFKIERAIAAKVEYWCGVESIPYQHKQIRETAVRDWKNRETKVQLFEVGSVFGIQGHVIDNRTYILGIQPTSTLVEAEQVASKLFDQYGRKTFVHPHLAKRPEGTIGVYLKGKPVDYALDLVRVRSSQDNIKVYRVEHGQGYKWHGFSDRSFAGDILVAFGAGAKLSVINRISLERMLQGLVPAEIYPTAPMEALKAQAVVARGELLAKIGSRHFLDPYLLCASTHCQVYAGINAETQRTDMAVRATRGEFLFHGSGLVDSVYSASCGGHTEDNDAVWSDPPNQALRGRPDSESTDAGLRLTSSEQWKKWFASSDNAFCNLSSFNRQGIFRWKKTYTSEKMDELIAKTKPIGKVVSIQVLSRGVSGRVKVVRFVGTEGELLIQQEWPIRKLLGNLKSGMFEIEVETDSEQLPIRFTFTGGGWGHGVGMCQIGAIGMAEHGYDYKKILAHYYGGAKVVKLYSRLLPIRDP